MKNQSRIAITAGLIALGLANAWAVVPPAQPSLPNIDKRTALTAAAQPNAVAQQAETALRARVPDLLLSRDRLLGTPRWVSASHGFLSGPGGAGKALAASPGFASPNNPQVPIRNFLNEHAALFGHDATVLDAARITRDFTTAHNGLHTVIWEQMVDEVPVFEGLLIGHVTKNGELVSLSSRFVPDAVGAADAGTPGRQALIVSPTITAAQAVVNGAANLGVTVDVASVAAAGPAEGPQKRQKLKAVGLAGDAKVWLVWLPLNKDSMRLCWQVLLTSRARGELYSVLVDAETGDVLVRRCLTNYLTDATYNVFTQESPAPMLPGLPTPDTTQAPLVQRQLIKLSALDTNASPNGWINDADRDTQGNNVDAHTDLNADDLPDLPRPTSATRVFDFPLDLTNGPGTYSEAAVVQLFYWCNWYHDKLYELGFTEAAGNFQNDNFGRGGADKDAVQADAQDGSGVDNANFATPPDGEPGRMQMYVFIDPNPDRDGDLDGTVVLHEHTHGLSNRLVGGGVGISELQPAGMGEGWSDFYAMTLLAPPTSDPHANFPEGGYITYQLAGLTENYYYGIRRYPYATDLLVNPLTFKDIDPNQANPHPGIPTSPIFGAGNPAEVHNQGEVWCVTLWEARANLIDKLGYDDGTRTVLQLVTDGMKLAPANPTFLEARDAIIQADEIDTGGDNRNELWLAFAKRGMGVNARAPSADTTVGVIEDFSLPDDVIIGTPDGILEVSVTPPSRSALFASDNQPIFVRVTDASSVTNAIISATVSTGGSLVFNNDGTPPDVTGSNSVYSALFSVPTNVTSVTITLVISAPNKVTSTNVIQYDVVPLPVNDNFVNSIKVPTTGAEYVSNNRFATIEPGEPSHAGVGNAASLWWTWASGVTTNVLVDTGNSLFDTVVAVYTGTQVSALTQVAAANDIGTRRQAYVTFNARAGTSYKIAVASLTTNATGTLHLRVAPGGLPDTSAPVVSFTSPPNGSVFTTNRVVVYGTAIDPQPNPSGINKILIGVTRSDQPDQSTEVIVTNDPANAIESTNWNQVVGLSEGVNTIRVTATDVAGNISLPATLHVTYQPRDPVNDLFNNAIALTGSSGISSVNTMNATKEPGEPLHAGNSGGKSAWWTFVPPADGVLTLSTTNSTFDTLLAVYLGNRVTNLTSVASNDDAYEGVTFSKISQAVRSNQVYRIAVDGFDAASGIVYLTYDFASSNVAFLTISTTEGGTVSPASGFYPIGSTVVLTATPNFHYDFIGWAQGVTTNSANPLSLAINGDTAVTALFSPHVFTEGFESGTLTALPWVTTGPVPWRVETNEVSFGKYAARSGEIGPTQSSVLSLTIASGSGVGAFDYKVSSETNFDQLEFYLNGLPNVVQPFQTWSGEVGWNTFRFFIPAGTNTMVWRYAKDNSISAGADAAFIDNLDLPLITPSLLLAGPSASGFRVEFQGSLPQTIRVECSTNLTSWQTLYTTNAAPGAVFQFIDPQGYNLPFRFYRAITP